MAPTHTAGWRIGSENLDIVSWRDLTGKNWPRFCSAYGCLNAPSSGVQILREEQHEERGERFVPLCSTCRSRTGAIALKPDTGEVEEGDGSVAKVEE